MGRHTNTQCYPAYNGAGQSMPFSVCVTTAVARKLKQVCMIYTGTQRIRGQSRGGCRSKGSKSPLGFHFGWSEYADQISNPSSTFCLAMPHTQVLLCDKPFVCMPRSCSARPYAMPSEPSRPLQPHIVQATFFLALSVAGQLGTATLAAHQVVAQLWLLPAYIVDAFAVAGTVLGSRIAANIEQEDAMG